MPHSRAGVAAAITDSVDFLPSRSGYPVFQEGVVLLPRLLPGPFEAPDPLSGTDSCGKNILYFCRRGAF